MFVSLIPKFLRFEPPWGVISKDCLLLSQPCTNGVRARPLRTKEILYQDSVPTLASFCGEIHDATGARETPDSRPLGSGTPRTINQDGWN